MTAKNTARAYETLSFLTLFIFCWTHLVFTFSIDFDTLTKLVKNISHAVVEGGGIVRSIRNHGIRDLPHRFRAKFPDTQGNRYYKKGRFISVYYDASPGTMKQVENLVRMDDNVLRQTHLKARSMLDYINNPNEKKNPYIRKVLREEALAMAAATEEDEDITKMEQEFEAIETVDELEAEALETIEELEAEAVETIEELEAEALETMEELEGEAVRTVEDETKKVKGRK